MSFTVGIWLVNAAVVVVFGLVFYFGTKSLIRQADEAESKRQAFWDEIREASRLERERADRWRQLYIEESRRTR